MNSRKMKFLAAKAFRTTYENSVDAFVPEFWANEGLVILKEEMVVANLVHRDYENQLARFGDVVNTRKPAEFVAVRKTDYDDVTIQDASATNIPVTLNQHLHTSFMIRDGEESKSMKDLIDEFLKPAVIALARGADQIVLGQYSQFPYFAGALGGLSAANSKNYLLDLRQRMNDNKAPLDGRNLILNSTAETEMLKTDMFVTADTLADGGRAMREAFLGKKMGFRTFMSQNMAVVNVGNTVKLGAINQSVAPTGYAKGSTTLVVDGFTGAVGSNNWITIAGDDTPHRVVSHTETSMNTTGIVIASPGLRRAVADNAVVTAYSAGAVNQSVAPTGYAAGWSKTIVVDGFTVAPQTGQMVSFGTTSTNPVYTIIGTPTTTAIVLDRPLEAAIADDAAVNIGPAGNYSLAFHKNAISFVVRPLAAPKAGAGAISAVINSDGLAIRVTIQYNATKMGHLVNLDFLCGVKVIEPLLGAVLLG